VCYNVKTPTRPGLPDPLTEGELAANLTRAREDILDTRNRGRNVQPGIQPGITDADIRALKLKFNFLSDYTDSFIRHATPECLVKLEATNLKMKEAERVRDVDERLAQNRAAASTHPKEIGPGLDDRCSILHEARFLPGAVCSTSKLWLAARQVLGLSGADPLANYDMASVGLGGQTTSKGWLEIANPSSTRMSIRAFNINNCGIKSSGSSGKDTKEDLEFLEVAEFTVALRNIRVAMHMVHPWNMSIVALENFLLDNKMCHSDIGGLDKQSAILTRFCDYVLSENAAKWRDETPFLTYNDLVNTWRAFFSALPQSQLAKPKQDSKHASGSNKQSSFNKQQSGKPRQWSLPYIEVCYKWNKNLCNKPDGKCTTLNGRALKHCCDERTNPADLSIYCGKAHKRIVGHP
jgi:hypothetical protein